MNKVRYAFLLLIDTIIITLALFLSLQLRFEGMVPVQYQVAMVKLMPLFILVSLFFLIAHKLYARVWEYASIGEMFAILRATTFGMGVIVLIIYIFPLPHLPRSIYILTWILMNLFIGASRLSWRLFKKSYFNSNDAEGSRVLIVGAGDAGNILVREIENNPALQLKAVGFVDDDPTKLKKILHDVPVLGTTKEIPYLVKEMAIDEIIIAMPSVSGDKIRPIFDLASKTNARVRILPGVYQNGKESI